MVEWRKLRNALSSSIVSHASELALLNRKTHPIAWAAVAYSIGKSTYQEYNDRSPLWGEVNFHVRNAIINFLIDRQLGSSIRQITGTPMWAYRGVTFGRVSRTNVRGPFGTDASVLIDWIWENYPHLEVESSSSRSWEDRYSITTDSFSSPHEPLFQTLRVIETCQKLRRHGKKVAVLLNGPPGSGKSEALTQIAHNLGGRTIRAALGDVDTTMIIDLCDLLHPDAIILDDIDRGPTSMVLHAVDMILRKGVAILASSNVKGAICDALLRAMRIDLHYTYDQTEEATFQQLTANLPESKVEALKPHTIATIARYSELLAILGEEDADNFLTQETKRRFPDEDRDEEEDDD